MNLSEFFAENRHVALAFSGGVDSAYLLYEAIKNKADVTAYYIKTSFQPSFEYEDAMRLAKELNARVQVIHADILSVEEVAANPSNRCYYCKNKLFGMIIDAAKKDGYDVILDGTNASDDAGDRPGMRALTEMGVRSPLRECGLTKDMIRIKSKEAGLFTWNKPAYACLATRISTGVRITEEKLLKTEKAEDYLFSLGFSDFRVRMLGENAKIQIKEDQIDLLLDKRNIVLNELKKYYKDVVLDLVFRA